MTIEERTRQHEKSQFSEEEYQRLHNLHGVNSPFGLGYYLGATEQQKIYKEIVDMLIDILQTSKNYHLGITGLDSEEEIIEKRKTRETALIRNIESKIKKAKQAMEE